MAKVYTVKGDEKLNPELKKQVVDLRSKIMGQCGDLPERFVLTMSIHGPRGTITDKQTGKTTSPVGLYALSDVVRVINELFG